MHRLMYQDHHNVSDEISLLTILQEKHTGQLNTQLDLLQP